MTTTVRNGSMIMQSVVGTDGEKYFIPPRSSKVIPCDVKGSLSFESRLSITSQTKSKQATTKKSEPKGEVSTGGDDS